MTSFRIVFVVAAVLVAGQVHAANVNTANGTCATKYNLPSGDTLCTAADLAGAATVTDKVTNATGISLKATEYYKQFRGPVGFFLQNCFVFNL